MKLQKLHPNDRLKFTMFGKTYRWVLVDGTMTLSRVITKDDK